MEAALPIISTILGGIGTIGGILQGNKANDLAQQGVVSTKNAASLARKDADRVRTDEQIAMNKADRKRPDMRAIMATQKQGMESGLSSTFLTGPGGVNPSSMTLGQTSILGA